jgi:hypothetical protein
VVAAEVRALALRSSESAKQIRQLISESGLRVTRGVEQIGSVSQTFAAINAGVQQLSEQVRAISVNASEQSVNLHQIAEAVGQLEQITHDNARMVEDASHQSQQLGERAQRLASAVAAFQLRQGCADEAMTLVKTAAACLQREGRAALRRITDDGKTFADRDMYVFAFDRQGIYRAFAGRPERVGTAVRDNPGVDGDRLVHDAFHCAAHGGGWVDYQFTNPQTGSVDLKTSFVLPLGDDMVIGCGIYKQRSIDPDEQAWLARRLVRAEHVQRLVPDAVTSTARRRPSSINSQPSALAA